MKKSLVALGLAFAMAGSVFAAQPAAAGEDPCQKADGRADLLQCFNALQSGQSTLKTVMDGAKSTVNPKNLQALEYKRRLDADCKKQALFKAFLVFEASGWARDNTADQTSAGVAVESMTRERLHGYASFGAECHAKTAMWMKAYDPLKDAAASHRAAASDMRALANRLKPKP